MEAGIHELTAGYALDALDPEERSAYEAHLPGCEHCQQELESFWTTTEALAVAASGPAPSAALRERILADVRAEPRQNVVAFEPRRRRDGARSRRRCRGCGRRRARDRPLGVEPLEPARRDQGGTRAPASRRAGSRRPRRTERRAAGGRRSPRGRRGRKGSARARRARSGALRARRTRCGSRPAETSERRTGREPSRVARASRPSSWTEPCRAVTSSP